MRQGSLLKKHGGDTQTPQARDHLELPPWASVHREVHLLLLTGSVANKLRNFTYTHFPGDKAEADKLSDSVSVLGPGRWQNQV